MGYHTPKEWCGASEAQRWYVGNPRSVRVLSEARCGVGLNSLQLAIVSLSLVRAFQCRWLRPEQNKTAMFLCGLTQCDQPQHLAAEEQLQNFATHYAALRGSPNADWRSLGQEGAEWCQISASFFCAPDGHVEADVLCSPLRNGRAGANSTLVV